MLVDLGKEPDWELIRPRIGALGKTIDLPRPSNLAAKTLFGFDPPGITAMAQVPTVLIPTMLVPLYLLNHLTVATHLARSKQRSVGNLPEFA